jgi:hypothetical protein
LEKLASDKYSSLFCPCISDGEKFIAMTTVINVIKLFYQLQTVVKFASKPWHVIVVMGLTRKCKEELEKLAGGKRSSLFYLSIIDEEK